MPFIHDYTGIPPTENAHNQSIINNIFRCVNLFSVSPPPGAEELVFVLVTGNQYVISYCQLV